MEELLQNGMAMTDTTHGRWGFKPTVASSWHLLSVLDSSPQPRMPVFVRLT